MAPLTLDEELIELRSDHPKMPRLVQIARGGQRLFRPHILDRDANAVVAGHARDNRALQLLLESPQEKSRIVAAEMAVIRTKRLQAASVALHALRAVDDHVER